MISTGRRTTKIWSTLPDGVKLLDAEWEGPLKCLWCVRNPDDLFVTKYSMRLASRMASGIFRICFLVPGIGGWISPMVGFSPSGNFHCEDFSLIKLYHEDYLVFDPRRMVKIDETGNCDEMPSVWVFSGKNSLSEMCKLRME